MAGVVNTGMSPGQQVELVDRQAQAVELRAAGLSYSEIAKRMECHRQTAASLVHAGLRAVVSPHVDEYRALEDNRLDLALSKVVEVLTNPQANDLRKLDAARTLVLISERRAKLHGLDAPAPEVPLVLTESTLRAALDQVNSQIIELTPIEDGDECLQTPDPSSSSDPTS